MKLLLLAILLSSMFASSYAYHTESKETNAHEGFAQDDTSLGFNFHCFGDLKSLLSELGSLFRAINEGDNALLLKVISAAPALYHKLLNDCKGLY